MTTAHSLTIAHSTLSMLGCAIEVFLPIPTVQAHFDPDVAHPMTDVRLYPYKGEGGILHATDRFLNVKDSASLSKTLDPQ